MGFGFFMAAAAAAKAARNKRPAQDEAHPATKARNKKRRTRYVYWTGTSTSKFIAEGAYGEVCKARDLRTGEMLAIKRIRRRDGPPPQEDHHGAEASPETMLACLREYDCLAACRGHPGVVQLKHIVSDEYGGDLSIVMELVHGPTLRAHLSTLGRPFTQDEARGAMRQLLEAADRMHAAGVTHRDISPDNILVGRGGGELTLCGFGCAMLRAGGATDIVPDPEKYKGTMQYRSPTLLNFPQCVGGPKDDMWSLGCVMAELLAGEPLFTETTEEYVLEEATDLDTMGEDAEVFERITDLSEAGRELLLTGLLHIDFLGRDRLTAADALKHRWFTEGDTTVNPPDAVQAVEP